MTDVVAATWRASGDVPLLHLPFDQVLEGRVDLSLDTGATALESTLTSPPVVQGDAARIATHVRGWSKNRRGVILTSTVEKPGWRWALTLVSRKRPNSRLSPLAVA